MTPEEFAKLTRSSMFAELRRLGVIHGQGSSEVDLVGYYREWYVEMMRERPSLADALANDETERRDTARRQIDVEIGLATETNFFVGFSDDISEGGIFVTTLALLPIGTSVTVSFTFPGGREVEVEGNVAWTRQGVAFDSDLEAGMGIRFTLLSDDALAAIREFTSVREPIFHVE